MQVQETTYGSLHKQTKQRFPDLDDTARVFLARSPSGRIRGTAYTSHSQVKLPTGRRLRDVNITVQADNPGARVSLITAARQATKHLKRAVNVRILN